MPRKTLKERQQSIGIKSSSRVNNIVARLIGKENSRDLMDEILSVLTETANIPEIGSIYTFVYSPKTPNIQYDQHPLVLVTDIFSWGFKGSNFHWGNPPRSMRQYTFDEVQSPLHFVRRNELEDMRTIPYQSFKLNT